MGIAFGSGPRPIGALALSRSFRRQLEYKAAHPGKAVFIVNRRYVSSKKCSSCENKMAKMRIPVGEWSCPTCHPHHVRDINAAIH